MASNQLHSLPLRVQRIAESTFYSIRQRWAQKRQLEERGQLERGRSRLQVRGDFRVSTVLIPQASK